MTISDLDALALIGHDMPPGRLREALQEVVREAVLEEREACAQLVELSGTVYGDERETLRQAAQEIRERD